MLFRKILVLLAAACSLQSAPPQKPKLVLFIVVDQFRYDYLTRYRTQFTGGFDRLLKHGANFTNDNDDFFPTLTACAHAALLTGAPPAASGIVGNDWFDSKLGEHVMSVTDNSVRLVGGGQGPGLSPKYLLAESVGDVLKRAHPKSRVIGVSMKDRSSMLLAGQHPDAAYWFDIPSGQFVTSSWYRDNLPEWVRAFNQTRPVEKYLGRTWAGHRLTREAAGYRIFERSPFGDELGETFAEKVLAEEHLGQGPETDMLTFSMPGPDYAGHDYGSGSPESLEALLNVDRLLGKLLQAVDRQVGLNSTLVVFTSDHGIPLPSPKGGRLPLTTISDGVQSALVKKYGEGQWIAGVWDLMVYLNTDLIAQKKLNRAEVNRAAAEALAALPHVALAYTREQLLDGQSATENTKRLMRAGWNEDQGADIEFLPQENWVFTSLVTTHGSLYPYDTHVPLIFMGPGIAAKTYNQPVRNTDIAPTVAKILGIPAPSLAAGRVIGALY